VGLVYLDASGNRTQVALGRPGGELRFSVGRPGESSGIWKVTASPNVAVMTLGLVRDAKITLHREGSWWLATHLVSCGTELTGRPSRELVRWTPPAPNAAGWVHALSVWVPHGGLNGVYTVDEANRPNRPVTWLSPAEPGHRVGVHLVLITPGGSAGGAAPGEYLGAFDLGDGRALLVSRTHDTYPPDVREPIDDRRRRTCEPDGPEGPTTRCLIGQHADGQPLRLWDLAPPRGA